MKIIDAKQCTAIALGRLGENEYTVVRFDVAAWLEELPGAVIGLYNQRPGDADAYPIAAIAVEDGVVTWTVTSAELTQTGEGRCELVAIAGEVVAKSAIFRTIVFDALDGSGEAPEPWSDWQQQFIILKGEAEQAADRAEEAVEHYPRIVDGVWEVWDGATEQWVSTGVQALGVDGVSPTITVAPITGGHRITITDANGTHTVDVLDGENGDAGCGIVSVQKTGTAGLVDIYTITYTDSTTSTFTVTNGQNGTDGISPSITITDITGGHRVTITDADGEHPFDVMDGATGATPQMSIGTVETLTPGSNATASLTGTAEAPVLNLGLPQGGVDLGLTAATVGQIAKITAVDANGRPTAWEPADIYPKKVFDYIGTDLVYRINVTAIDYENGVLTLEQNDAPFTDDWNTTIQFIATPLLEGYRPQYKFGMMPKELYSNAQNIIFFGKLVGENQIQVRIGNSSTGTDITSFTQTDNIDLSRWQIFAQKQRNTLKQSISFDGIEPTHRYRIKTFFPYGGGTGGTFLDGMKAADKPNVWNNAFGERYGEGYGSFGLTANFSRNELNQPRIARTNSYEFLPRYIASGYDSPDNAARSSWRQFPCSGEYDLFPVSDHSWTIHARIVFAAIPDVQYMQANKTPMFFSATVTAYLNGVPAKAYSEISNEGGRFTIYDMGVEQ